MGTRFRIVLYAPDASAARRAARAAFDRIAKLDDIMSDYRANSELMSLCRAAGGPPVKVSEDLFRVLNLSQQLAKQTDGAFDVTVGPLTRIWRRARRQRQMPDPEDLARALSLVGLDKLRLDAEAWTAQLLRPGMLLDLGGIAKGYAADEALAVLKRHGIRSALVAAGGDIAVSKPPPGREGWRIGIASLEAPNKSRARYLKLRDSAVSTSGDGEHYVEIDGKRYSHIVDPRTGLGLEGRSGVTVVARNATTSDSLATAVSVLGPQRGREVIRATRGAAMLFVRATDNGIEEVEEGLRRLLASTEAKGAAKPSGVKP